MRLFRRLASAAREELDQFRRRGRILWVTPLIQLLPYGTMIRARTSLYRLGGVRIGEGSAVVGPLRIWGPGQLSLGRSSTINGPCAICLDEDVELGNGVLVGHDVIITTGSHLIGPATARGGPVVPHAVSIGDGVWIGAGVMILPGVSIGAGSVIAAGAIVTKDVPPNSLALGVPARVVRTLPTAIDSRDTLDDGTHNRE